VNIVPAGGCDVAPPPPGVNCTVLGVVLTTVWGEVPFLRGELSGATFLLKACGGGKADGREDGVLAASQVLEERRPSCMFERVIFVESTSPPFCAWKVASRGESRTGDGGHTEWKD